jgi:hypothetical protein
MMTVFDDKKKAKIIWKQYKACSFDSTVLLDNFEVTDEDLLLYNRYYGRKFGVIRR